MTVSVGRGDATVWCLRRGSFAEASAATPTAAAATPTRRDGARPVRTTPVHRTDTANVCGSLQFGLSWRLRRACIHHGFIPISHNRCIPHTGKHPNHMHNPQPLERIHTFGKRRSKEKCWSKEKNNSNVFCSLQSGLLWRLHRACIVSSPSATIVSSLTSASTPTTTSTTRNSSSEPTHC